MNLFKKVIFTVAAALFIWVIVKSGPLVIWHQIISLNWRILIVIIAYLVIYYFDTMGWRLAFAKDVKLPNLWRFFLARQAGEALNYTTPTAYLGGEPVKAIILKKRYGVNIAEGFSSVVIAKTTLFLSKVVFLLMGITLALNFLKFDSLVATGILWTFIGVFGLFVVFILLQRKGLFMLGLKIARKFKLNEMFEDKKAHLEEIDQTIGKFYLKDRLRLFGSFFFHLLGWIAGLIEVYIILYFLGINIGWVKAFVIEVFLKTANSAFFFVPAAIGVQESAGYAVLTALGLGGEIGVALSLIKRIREIVWAGFGLVVYWKSPK
ncbi:MAG: flippase-like domain-containing protein [Candidatus Omnitrophota bacterium]